MFENIGTNETQSFALKIGHKIKYNREKVMGRVVKFEMNLKIEDANRDIKNEKENLRRKQDELDAVVRPSTIAGREYRRLVKHNL